MLFETVQGALIVFRNRTGDVARSTFRSVMAGVPSPAKSTLRPIEMYKLEPGEKTLSLDSEAGTGGPGARFQVGPSVPA